MTPTALGIVSGVLLAVAFFLDIRFSKSRSKIHDRFLRWWLWFSNLRIRQAIERSISISITFFDLLCGRKIFSLGAIVRSSLAVAIIAVLRFLWLTRNDMSPIWQRALGIALLILPVIPPAVIVLISIRILLRYAAKKPNLFRLLALGIVNLLLVQFGIEIISFIYGLSTQAWIDAAYAHRIPIEGTEAVLAGGFAYFFAFSRIYGYLALLPAIVFAALFVCWILIIAAAAICRLIEEFLRLQVEEADSRPFTAFATALCMLIALYSGARLLPYGVIGHYLQFMEHRINRWGFDLGERSISRRPEAPDKEYILYNVQCQAFLIATEFIGPSAQAAQNIQSRVSKVLKEWGESNEPAAVTPAPKIPKK